MNCYIYLISGDVCILHGCDISSIFSLTEVDDNLPFHEYRDNMRNVTYIINRDMITHIKIIWDNDND